MCVRADETRGVSLLVDATFSSCILDLRGAGLHALTRVWANSRALIAYWVMKSGFDRRAVPPSRKSTQSGWGHRSKELVD